MLKNDRFTAGAISGIIGAIAQEIYGYIAKASGLTNIAFIDFAEAIIFNAQLKNFIGIIAGIISHLVFGAMLGVLFAYIIYKTSNNYYYFKALGYAAGIWFWSLAFGTMYKINVFNDIQAVPAISVFIGAQVYGLVLAICLKILENKSNMV